MNLSSIPNAAQNATAHFAHLLGRGNLAAKKKAVEGDEDEKEEEKKEDEKKEGKKAEDEKNPPKDDKEDGKKAKGKKADDDENGDDPCMEDKKEKEEEDEDEGEKKSKKKAASGFDRATLARCEAIFTSPHATGRPDVAASLAFRSKLSADEAADVMESMGPVSSRRENLTEKMAKVPNPEVGVDGGPAASDSKATTLANRIIAAGEKANGGK